MNIEPNSENDPVRATSRMPAGGGAAPQGTERVTQRLPDSSTVAPEGSVTTRFPGGGPQAPPAEDTVTQRFEAAPAVPSRRSADAAGLSAGELVADRYRVVRGPIGAATGEAEVFLCIDEQTHEDVALKYYHEKMSPKKEILDRLLSLHHPYVVALREHGVWADRSYEIMEYCGGGSLTECMPLDEEALRGHVEHIATALHYLHSQGIIHRDIKPNNLFLRRLDPPEVVIGDFGVSSKLDATEQVRKTSTGGFFTLDYAAPELIDGKQVGPKTDYYSLGITLMHLLAGASPFVGMDQNTIMGCHFRGSIPRPDGLSPEFRKLIDGLVRVSPGNRWGYSQVLAWLKGEMVMTDDGVPDHEEVAVGKKMPYRSMPEITTPREMAGRLGEFDVQKDLQRGFVSQWLMFFDTELGRRAAALEEEFSADLRLGEFKLLYLLDPLQPLEVAGRKVYNVAQLADLLAEKDPRWRAGLADLLYSHCLELWVAAIQTDEIAAALVAQIRSLRERVQDPELALFALLHTLDPTRPLVVGETMGANFGWDPANVANPDELAELLAERPGFKGDVRLLLFNGWLEEWLRAAFPDRTGDIAFLKHCTTHYKDDQEHGFFAFRCHFDHLQPLTLGTRNAKTPQELAALISSDDASFKQGTAVLTRGYIRTWLVETGLMQDPGPFDKVMKDRATSWPRKMEAVLHILDQELPWPVLATDADRVDAGSVTTEQSKTVHIQFFNSGRGFLAGTATLAANSPGFSMDLTRIEGDPVTVAVTVRGVGLPIGSRQEASVVAQTNGGRLEIPVYFTVKAPVFGFVVRSLIAGACIGASMGLIRLLLQTILPEYRLTTMTWAGAAFARSHTEQWALVPVTLLMVVVVGAAVYSVFAARKRKGR